MKIRTTPAGPGETFEGLPVLYRCCVEGGGSIPVIASSSDAEWEAACRRSAIRHLERAGLEPTERRIEEYHAFVHTTKACCSGNLFYARLREVIA